MNRFMIEGGVPLVGSVHVQGAKNSILPILAATMLHKGVSVLHNCPQLTDVSAALAILRHLGCVATQEGSTITVDATEITRCDIPHCLMREMRSSVLFLGAVLGRTGGANLSLPGGCELGPRPIDLHLMALRAMGADIDEEGGDMVCSGTLKGCDINLSIPSVGATENAMIAAVSALGTTTITNVAREPEIVDLQNFLQNLGAKVEGAGSSLITIQGGAPLHDGEHAIIGDRIVGATYLAAVAATGGELYLTGVEAHHLTAVLHTLGEAGCQIEAKKSGITMAVAQPLKGVRPVRTAPYPGFPTDSQALMMATFAKSCGTTVFVENIFSSRYRHVDELCCMGADIRVEGRVAVVYGVKELYGTLLRAHDLRGGAALVVAALSAKGESQIENLHYIDRGYQSLETDLQNLGAQIRRQ